MRPLIRDRDDDVRAHAVAIQTAARQAALIAAIVSSSS